MAVLVLQYGLLRANQQIIEKRTLLSKTPKGNMAKTLGKDQQNH